MVDAWATTTPTQTCWKFSSFLFLHSLLFSLFLLFHHHLLSLILLITPKDPEFFFILIFVFVFVFFYQILGSTLIKQSFSLCFPWFLRCPTTTFSFSFLRYQINDFLFCGLFIFFLVMGRFSAFPGYGVVAIFGLMIVKTVAFCLFLLWIFVCFGVWVLCFVFCLVFLLPLLPWKVVGWWGWLVFPRSDNWVFYQPDLLDSSVSFTWWKSYLLLNANYDEFISFLHLKMENYGRLLCHIAPLSGA